MPIREQFNDDASFVKALRDWFAGLALVGSLIDEGIESGRRESGIAATCRDAYRYADAMLEEREK